jgi:hypothetical protein
MKITSVLYCDAIEPALKFWVDRLGFTKTVEVPEGDKLGFVILTNGSAEVMMQTRKSVESDVPNLLEHCKTASLFIEVEDFAEIKRRIAGFEVLMPERVAFYGMREIAVREPGGNLVCFAAREA